MVLALSERLPSNQKVEAIAIEIGRLESVGESIMEHIFVFFEITYPHNWMIPIHEIVDLRIEMLKESNLNNLARLFF